MVKRKNPDTSNDAFKSLKHSEIQQLYEKIIWGLGQIGEGTFEDISQATRLPKDRVWRRLSELLRDGKIYRPGTKKVLASGREGYTYKLTENNTPPPQLVTERFPKGKSMGEFAKEILQQSLF